MFKIAFPLSDGFGKAVGKKKQQKNGQGELWFTGKTGTEFQIEYSLFYVRAPYFPGTLCAIAHAAEFLKQQRELEAAEAGIQI